MLHSNHERGILVIQQGRRSGMALPSSIFSLSPPFFSRPPNPRRLHLHLSYASYASFVFFGWISAGFSDFGLTTWRPIGVGWAWVAVHSRRGHFWMALYSLNSQVSICGRWCFVRAPGCTSDQVAYGGLVVFIGVVSSCLIRWRAAVAVFFFLGLGFGFSFGWTSMYFGAF